MLYYTMLFAKNIVNCLHKKNNILKKRFLTNFNGLSGSSLIKKIFRRKKISKTYLVIRGVLYYQLTIN